MKNNNNISSVLLVVGFIAVSLFILKAADGSLDFYGSIGFDMFKDKSPFEDNKHKYHNNDNDNDRKLTVKVNTDYKNSIKVKAGSETEIINANDNGKAKTTMWIDDDVRKVCLSVKDDQVCQKINDDVSTITFNLN